MTDAHREAAREILNRVPSGSVASSPLHVAHSRMLTYLESEQALAEILTRHFPAAEPEADLTCLTCGVSLCTDCRSESKCAGCRWREFKDPRIGQLEQNLAEDQKEFNLLAKELGLDKFVREDVSKKIRQLLEDSRGTSKTRSAGSQTPGGCVR